MKVTRTEQHQINKSHPYYKVIDTFCYRSKNLYNYANYIIRQSFIDTGIIPKYKEMQTSMKNTHQYKELMSQSSQCTLQVLDRNWKSFLISIKDYSENPNKYLGKPRIPKYKKKNGRFPWYIKNNTSYIKDGRLYFRLKVFNGYSFKTNAKGRLISVRFIPKGSCYILEIIYEQEINEPIINNNNFLSIDLGVNNFVTMVNNIGENPIIINGKIIKSYNQWFNKRRSVKMSSINKRNKVNWCNYLNKITKKRENKLNNYLHHVSKFIINYCKHRNIRTIIIGKNDRWKQNCNLGHKTNQNFIFIPYEKLIHMLIYKGDNEGIKVIKTNEDYTSGTSFLDNEEPIKENYDKSRRVYRGLFKANNGQLINSDVNGAYQIMKKVVSDFKYTEEIGASLVPIVINLGN